MKLKDLRTNLNNLFMYDDLEVNVLDHSKGDYFPIDEIAIVENIRNNKAAITLTSYGIEKDAENK
jgi:hypothetical protein